jgi:hypothetical protein
MFETSKGFIAYYLISVAWNCGCIPLSSETVACPYKSAYIIQVWNSLSNIKPKWSVTYSGYLPVHLDTLSFHLRTCYLQQNKKGACLTSSTWICNMWYILNWCQDPSAVILKVMVYITSLCRWQLVADARIHFVADEKTQFVAGART